MPRNIAYHTQGYHTLQFENRNEIDKHGEQTTSTGTNNNFYYPINEIKLHENNPYPHSIYSDQYQGTQTLSSNKGIRIWIIHSPARHPYLRGIILL